MNYIAVFNRDVVHMKRKGWHLDKVQPILYLYNKIKLAEDAAMLAIRLPADVEARLDAMAKATGRTKSFYVRQAILEHLDDLEDLYLAEQRSIDQRAGKSDTVPLEEVMKRYGMES